VAQVTKELPIVNIASLNISRRARIILAVGIVLLWILVRQQISRMDERFFQPSFPGIKGLALYAIGNYSGAAKAYREHFQELYQTEKTATDPGWDALLRGDFQGAEEIAKKALEKDPTAIAPLLTLGEIALEKGAFQEALSIFAQILGKEPNQFDAHLLSSVALSRSGAYGEAIHSLNLALRTNTIESRITSFLKALETTGDLGDLPAQKRPHCLLAHYYRYLRLFDPSNGRAAIDYANKAITLGDRPADAYLTLAIIYDKQEKREKSLQAILKAVEVNPKHAEALRWAAFIHSKRGDLLNEYRMAKAAFEAAPEDPFYITHLDHVLVEKLGDVHQALGLMQQALKSTPNNPKALDRLGDLYGMVGNYEQSLDYYRKALVLEPLNAILYEEIGFSLDRLGRIKEAISTYRKAASIAPTRPQPHSGLASLYHGAGRYREAIKEYEEAIRLGERSTTELSQLCSLYHYVTSDFQRAANCFNEVLRRDPRNRLANRLLPETLHNLRLQKATR